MIHNFIQMLGAIPLGSTMKQSREMAESVHSHIARGDLITIYPEAHIWLFYTGIRPFPKVVTYLDGPYFPDMSLPLPERKQKLRDQCHTAMVRRAEENSTYVYYEYREEA